MEVSAALDEQRGGDGSAHPWAEPSAGRTRRVGGTFCLVKTGFEPPPVRATGNLAVVMGTRAWRWVCEMLKEQLQLGEHFFFTELEYSMWRCFSP